MQICHEMLVYKDIIHFLRIQGFLMPSYALSPFLRKYTSQSSYFYSWLLPIMLNIGIKFSYIKKKNYWENIIHWLTEIKPHSTKTPPSFLEGLESIIHLLVDKVESNSLHSWLLLLWVVIDGGGSRQRMLLRISCSQGS